MIVTAGSKFGPHVLRNGEAGEKALLRAKHEGWAWPIHKNVHVESLALTAKRLNPKTITVTRIKTAWDDPSYIFGKSNYEHEARILLDFVRSEVPVDVEWNAADYKEVLNESDPPGVAGYRELGLFWQQVCREAERRGFRVAGPAFNYGTPEWGEMQAFVDTGVFVDMKRGGHVLTVHEGILPHESLTPPWAGVLGVDPDARPIPGAPFVFGAGDGNLRYRYLYALLKRIGQVVPLIVSEWYGGGTYDPAHISVTLRNLFWYDLEVRKDWYVLGVTPFTCDPDERWSEQNYNYLLESWMLYMRSQRDIPNALPETIPPSSVRTNQDVINALNRARKRLAYGSDWWQRLAVKGGMGYLADRRKDPYDGPFNLSPTEIATILRELTGGG
jgi:hypothetical protein